MNAAEQPSFRFGRQLSRTLDTLGVFVAMLSHDPETEERAMDLERRLTAGRRQVLGNKDLDHYTLNVGDLRLIVDSDLKVLREELRQATGTEP